MSITSIGAYQSTTYMSSNSTSTSSVSQQNSSQTVSSSQSGGDTFEKSAAANGGNTSATCPKGNSTCLGCGSCQSSKSGSTTDIMDTGNQSMNTTMLNALNAYDSQSKFL